MTTDPINKQAVSYQGHQTSVKVSHQGHHTSVKVNVLFYNHYLEPRSHIVFTRAVTRENQTELIKTGLIKSDGNTITFPR